ncbi:MAG: aldehyde dehydrogenase [Gracilibacteraceae bacterium]|jgi:propionaldehyde dehydrogenase|nr:aldehyde dehydrogenase [Gracilibacteraceae bacterium]
MADYSAKEITAIVEEIVSKINSSHSGATGDCGRHAAWGVFAAAAEAVDAAEQAQRRLTALSLDLRKAVIQSIRAKAMELSDELGRMELAETGMGRLENKIFKIRETITKTPGVENITPETFSGGHGLTVVENNPWGVCGCVLPSTAPAATAIHNSIVMIAAGNSAVMCPHPNAGQTSLFTVEMINKAVTEAGGPANLITTFADTSQESTSFVMRHPSVQIILVTGGPGIVQAAFQSGKRAICAGPGNPPVLVDGTTDLAVSARQIFAGCSFENCINCIGEKEVFVVKQYADELIRHLKAAGCYHLADAGAIAKLTALTTNGDGSVNKQYIGKDAAVILKGVGIEADERYKVISYEVPPDHITVKEEYLMPLLPIVRVDSVEHGIACAVAAEGGRRHSAVIHSHNMDTVTKYANATRTTVLAVNGSSYNGVGMEGEGFVTMSIATATGEGLTCPRVFTRVLRRAFTGSLGQYIL